MTPLGEEYHDLVRALRLHLQWLQAGGALGVPISPPALRAAPAPAPILLERPAPPPAAAPVLRAPPPPRSSARLALAVYPELPDPWPLPGAAGLEQIRGILGECTRCKLCHGRNQIVYGQGAATPPVVFVGEGPGAEEDRTGLPFVGAAGDLLTRMIAAMGLGREQVYICNVVKCRPPGNRAPEPDEMAACGPFLRAQLQALRPRVIVALGRTPAQFLLGSAVSITRIRGQWSTWEGIPLMPTFHPAYLLRTPSAKRDVWEDLKQVMAELKKNKEMPQ